MSMLYFGPIRELRLPARAKWLLFLIGDNANDSGYSWPGLELLIRHSELPRSTVLKYLRTFREDGVLCPFENEFGGRGKIKGWWIDIKRAMEIYRENGAGFGCGADTATAERDKSETMEKGPAAGPFTEKPHSLKGPAAHLKGPVTNIPPRPPHKDEPKEPITRSPCGDLSAPGGAPAPAPDLKSRIFGPALDWLAQQSGRPKDKLRTMVGRWCRDHGDGQVLEAFAQAARCGPVEPVAWIEQTLKEEGHGKRFGKRDGPTAGQIRAAGLLGCDLGS